MRHAEKVDIKITLVGNQGIGKTALVMRFKTGNFNPDISNTIGAHFVTLEKPSRDGKALIKVNIWDTAGMERFRSLVPMYIRGAAVVLLCFDSFRVSDIKEHIGTIRHSNENCEIVLVQTKKDDPRSDKASDSEIEEFASYATTQNLKIYKTSSKTGANVDSLFEELIEKIYTIKKNKDAPPSEGNIVNIREAQPATSQSYCCTLM